MLAERDFDGKRAVKMTPSQLEALNAAFARLAEDEEPQARTVFEAQGQARSKLFKRLQYLS
jgi:citrate lyase beta subunit